MLDIPHGRVEELTALLDELNVGLVSVNPAADFAVINATAAALLNTFPGTVTTAEFAAILQTLAEQASNRDEALANLDAAHSDPDFTFRSMWAFSTAPHLIGVASRSAPFPGFDGRIWALYDNSQLAHVVAAADDAGALIRASGDAMPDPMMVLEARWDGGRVVDLVYREVNTACYRYFGLTREEMVGRSVWQSPLDFGLVDWGLFDHVAHCAQTGEPVVLDAFPYCSAESAPRRYYDVRATRVRPGLVSATWRDVTERMHAEQQIAASEEQFRLLAENVADVVARVGDDGRIIWISHNVEAALGAPADYYIGRHVMDFVPPEARPTYRSAIAQTLAGDTFIGRFRIIDADGVPHCVHQAAKPFHDADGSRNGIVVSFRVIDDEVAAESRAKEQIAQRDAENRKLTARLQSQTHRLLAELRSAAKYFKSILPSDLDGPVRVSSRYVPSLHLSGDSYDYRWVDDDHLIVYLVDVSGHGVESAMLSASVHNLMRSGTLSTQKLLQPAAVLAELNRLFQMEQQDGHYLTIWYGVYELSTRRLRYARGGHPPALALTRAPDGRVTTTALTARGLPIGMFEETKFTSETFAVPPGAEIVLYSDGAFELDLAAGQWDARDFADLCARLAASPDWSIDDLLAELRSKTPSGDFEDDCTLVRLIFD